MKRRAGGHRVGVEILVVALCLVLLGFFVSQKEGFHMDELLSFELSNGEYNPWIVTTQPEGRLAKFIRCEIKGDTLRETLSNLAIAVEDVVRNRGNSRLLTYKADVYEEPVWITGQQFRDYITVGKEDAFNYLSVYFNVKDDNHPPLHFMFLHTISSIFQGKASPWMGCAINLAAVAAVMVLLIKLGRMLAEALGMERYSRFTGILCALLYGISSGVVATVLLIRMYAMLTLWCVAFLYLVLRKWRDRSFDRDNKGLIAVTVLGFWTQYFFLFYCMILAVTALILLLSSKRFREFLYLLRSLVIAAAVGVALFPFAISDVLSSGRGVEALENLSQGLSGYGERVAAFGGILLEKTLSPGVWLLTAVGTAACVVWLLRRKASTGAALEKAEEGSAGGVSERAEKGSAEAAFEKAEEGSTGAALEKTEEGIAVAVSEKAEEGSSVAALEKAAEKSAGGALEKAGKSAPGAAGRGAYMALVLLPVAGYFLLAARMSPYLVDRYVMPVFPFAALAGGVLLTWVLSFLASGLCREAGDGQSVSCKDSAQGSDSREDSVSKGDTGKDSPRGTTGKARTWDVPRLCACGLCVLMMILQGAALWGYDGEYLYLGYQEQEDVAAAHGDEACICIYDGVGYYENLKEFAHYDRSLLLTAAELEDRQDTGSIEDLGRFVLLVKGGVRVDEVLEVFAEKYGYAPREQIQLSESVHGDSLYVMIPARSR